MSFVKAVARNLDEPARIVGLSPLELSSCAIFYAVIGPVLKGIPYSALLSLIITAVLGITLLVFNRNFPPYHGLFLILQLLRPKVVSVMSFGNGVDHEHF